MATIETTKTTAEYVEGVEELANSVAVARQEDAGSSTLRTIFAHPSQIPLPSPARYLTHSKSTPS